MSDIGSILSDRAAASVSGVSTNSSSPRVNGHVSSSMHTTMTPHMSSMLPPSARRAINAQRALDELSGEGSQSEGLDSPT